MVWVSQPIGFESRTPMPLQRTYQVQVFETRTPRIEDDALGLELSLICFLNRISDLIVFGFGDLVGIIDPEINGNYR